jgi:hypothetical protein
VFHLYGSKREIARRLVATFDSEQQLLAYVRWATLGGPGKKPKSSTAAPWRCLVAVGPIPQRKVSGIA